MNLPTFTQAAILVEQRKPLQIIRVRLPETLQVGQVLVKIFYSGICGSQLGEIDGVKGADPYLPHLLGHEGAGEVLAIGAGVENVKPGDKVVLHWRPSRGIQGKPPVYDWDGKRVSAGWVTTFNEMAIVSENRLTAIGSDADLRVAALLGCAVTTGFGVVVNDARLTIGESVVVYGAGGVGLNIVQAASLVSAFPIVAVDLHDNRLELAKAMGATHTINASAESNPAAAIANIVQDVGVDCFVDNTGRAQIIEMGYRLVTSQGRVVLVGVPRADQNITIHSLPMHFGKQMRGSHGGGALPDVDIPRYLRMFEQGRICLRELVTEEVPLTDINDAISRMRDGRIAGRCLIAF